MLNVKTRLAESLLATAGGRCQTRRVAVSMSHSRALWTMAIALSLLQPIDMCADDWPQWRGPNRDGVWRESGIFDAIPVSGLQVGWRARIGAGYSGPVVAQGRVFVTDSSMIRRSNVLCVWRK